MRSALLVVAIACSGDGDGLRETVEQACAALAKGESPALANVRDREAAEALAGIAAAPPAKRGPLLATLVERAGLASCAGRSIAEIASTPTYFGVALPSAPAPCSATMPTVRIERTAIVVGGRIAVALPPPADAPPIGRKVAYEVDATGLAEVIVVADRDVDGAIVAEAIGGAGAGNARRFELIVDAGSCTGAIALAGRGAVADAPLAGHVAIKRDALAFSIEAPVAEDRGPNVTLEHVRTELHEVFATKPDDLAGLQSELRSQIMQPSRKLARTVTLAVDKGVSVQRIVDAMLAVMRDDRGELFSRVHVDVVQ